MYVFGNQFYSDKIQVMRVNHSQRPSIDSRVMNIMIEKLGLEVPEISGDASFANDLNVDSLDLCEVFMELEKEFSIKIPDEDAEKLTSIDSVINYIKRKYTYQ